ncbi:hypothetical protein SAMN04487948_107111 [Halogranum amylolyticum]|uniref:Uncharacterized protein n=1 Tax=Halogranum amylolyticum TaxID=660520 RepID=A0A1H8TJ53_9EURY|nr:hypothetical protein [Halogranum amylolyticum]SEO91110.1 hypothetical protein SAMN04487948_107111 [Halogranum amylolyticum]
MPEITVSEELYRQLQAESDDGDIEGSLWKMVALYRRSHNPEADTD